MMSRLEGIKRSGVLLAHYNYAAGVDDVMSRLSPLSDGASDIYAEYKYLGAGRIVEEATPAATLSYDPDGDNSFSALDRFGRVVDQIWTDAADEEVDWYHYEYDRAGNRISRENIVSKNQGTPVNLDETYYYDNVDRLIEWKLNGASQKTWTLDALGNNVSETTGGTYNAANEQETIVGSQVSPDYDAAGNMIVLSSGMTAKYDAWNHMTQVSTGSGENLEIVQQNQYDGTNRRIRLLTDFDGTIPEKAQDDYHLGQQIIETREAVRVEGAWGASAVKYQFLWSPRYIDAPILRDSYSGGNIVTADRILYLGDANYNVTGLMKQVDIGGGQTEWQVVERYTYTPYGEVTYRFPNWSAYSDPNPQSLFDNTTLYTGRLYDVLTKLYYYRARFYDAVLERFVTTDPIESDFNLYRYCDNNSLIYIDPTGLKTLDKNSRWKLLACAEKELRRKGITGDELIFRLQLIYTALHSRMAFGDGSYSRNEDFWLWDKNNNCWKVQPDKTPCAAIDSLAEGCMIGSCRQISLYLILKTICDYCKSKKKEYFINDILKQFSNPTDIFPMPGESGDTRFGEYHYYIPSTEDGSPEKGLLLPGDQIHVRAPDTTDKTPGVMRGSNKFYVCEGKYISYDGQSYWDSYSEMIQDVFINHNWGGTKDISKFKIDHYLRARIPDVCK
jgi:RHS repeat-associated protein